MDNDEGAAQARRERRAWIREHHPDLGGDAAEFAAGLTRSERPRPSVRSTRTISRTLKRLRRKLVAALRRRRRGRGRRVL